MKRIALIPQLLTATLLTFSTLLIIGYEAWCEMNNWRSMKENKERISSNIINVSPEKDTISLKDGQFVYVTGYIASNDTLTIPIMNRNGEKVEEYKDSALYAYCCLHGHRKKDITYELTVHEAHIGNLPVDTALLTNYIEATETPYYKSIGYKETMTIETVPQGPISMIAMWKDGKLQLTGDGDPLAYCLAKDVAADKLFDGLVNKPLDDLNTIGGLALVASIILATLLVICYFKKPDNEEDTNMLVLDECKGITSRIKLLRWFLLLVLSILPVTGYAILLPYFDVYEIMVGYFLILLYITIISFANFIYSSYYKKTVVQHIIKSELHKLSIGAFQEIKKSGTSYNLSIETFKEMGLYSPMEDDNGFFGSIKYSYNEEDTYTISSLGKEMTFFEYFVRKIEREGKISSTEIVFNSFCIKIPLKNFDSNISFLIENEEYAGNSELKTFYKKHLSWNNFPDGMKLLMERSEVGDKLLSDTPFLDNVCMIKDVVLKMIGETNVIFSVKDKYLYVFVVNDLDRFDISLTYPVNEAVIRRDIMTIKSMCEIIKKWNPDV